MVWQTNIARIKDKFFAHFVIIFGEILSLFRSSTKLPHMKTTFTHKIVNAILIITLFTSQAFAQSKDVDKGKEMLTKAMDQKDPAKRQDMINNAKAMLQKGGLKPQEMATLVGDAYLDKGDLVNAANSYSAASKEDRKEGFKKVADAYVDAAFAGDDKSQDKSIKKAMDYYRKADAYKEGARTVGDKYYEKGPDSYAKALDYYIQGDAKVKIEAIANDYYNKGGDNVNKAAEVYLKLKSTEGYHKAGDIYYSQKEYQKASEAYLAGNDVEGIRKYADYLYAQNRSDEADNLVVKLGEIYANQKDDAGLEKLASECMNKGSYGLAARIYDKAGNTTLSDKCFGDAALIAFNIDSAKIFFGAVNDANMLKAINDNAKTLSVLKDAADNFEDLMKLAPPVNMIVDSVTGTSTPSPADQKLLEDYYKSVRDQIIKDCYDVSANINKLTSADLKKFARIRFRRYGAVRNILDADSFAIKKQKLDIKTKDVVL
jgi:hypothetical protein